MFVSHLVRTLGTQLAKWWWWTWCMCAAISLVEIRGKLAACCPHVISVTLDKNNISGCAQPIYYNHLHSGWSTLMKVKKQELVKSLCCCMTLNWRDQRDRTKCWKLLKKVNARMISLPPPPILKVIHRSHHSRCGEEILGSHTGAPTATQGLPLGTKPEISTLWRSWGSTGAPQQGKYISGGSHTNMHEIHQQGHHSQENISGAVTLKYISNISTRAPQQGKYISASHTAPLAFMPSQRNHTKQRHTTRKAKEVK